MTTDDRLRPVMLALLILGLAGLLIGATVVAAFVPMHPCPQRKDHDEEELFPCFNCNGYGRSTLFQKWNYNQWYEQQLENARKVKM
ncbi:MAG TPA: hypothetical protein VM222_03370 [Planctomycetota bacterium]|nr:hypothetical protein [Planctomycetota bacterium]